MTAYRIAVLRGNSPRLSALSVRRHLTVTAASYCEALKLVARLNAVVVASYPSKGGLQ